MSVEPEGSRTRKDRLEKICDQFMYSRGIVILVKMTRRSHKSKPRQTACIIMAITVRRTNRFICTETAVKHSQKNKITIENTHKT